MVGVVSCLWKNIFWQEINLFSFQILRLLLTTFGKQFLRGEQLRYIPTNLSKLSQVWNQRDENFKTKRSGDERVRKRMITACFQEIPFKTAATSFAAVFITVKMSAIVFLSKTLHSLSQKRVSTLALFRQWVREKKGPTKEALGEQHRWMDRVKVLRRRKRSWKQNKMEGEGCNVQGAPTVIDYGIGAVQCSAVQTVSRTNNLTANKLLFFFNSYLKKGKIVFCT